jgi:hypothetical protein
MGMLQSAIIELEMLERTNNETAYEQLLDRAKKILQGVGTLLEYLVNPNNPPDGSFQSLA